MTTRPWALLDDPCSARSCDAEQAVPAGGRELAPGARPCIRPWPRLVVQLITAAATLGRSRTAPRQAARTRSYRPSVLSE